MPIPLAAPALATVGRYLVKNGAKKAIQKYGDDAVKVAMKEKNLKTVGDKVVKKRMTAAQRKIQSSDFNKGLAQAQKDKKGLSNKDFFAKVEADLAKQVRIDKVKAENMAAAKKPMYTGGRAKYNKGGYAKSGQPMYGHGECPKAKAN